MTIDCGQCPAQRQVRVRSPVQFPRAGRAWDETCREQRAGWTGVRLSPAGRTRVRCAAREARPRRSPTVGRKLCKRRGLASAPDQPQKPARLRICPASLAQKVAGTCEPSRRTTTMAKPSAGWRRLPAHSQRNGGGTTALMGGWESHTPDACTAPTPGLVRL